MSDFVTENSLLKRAYIFLEDEEWESADEYFEKVLDADPENAYAYLGKLLVDLKVKSKEALYGCTTDFIENKFYQKVMRYGDESLKAEISGYAKAARIEVQHRAEQQRIEAERLAEEKRIEKEKKAEKRKKLFKNSKLRFK